MKNLIVSFLFLYPFLSVAAIKSDSAFTEKPVMLKTATGDIYGTLTTPASFTKGAVVLIIAGSGPTDRNGNNPMMKNNSLQQLAFALANAGIASLRFDKRGIAESSNALKEESAIRFEDYIHDISDWLLFLKRDQRFSQIIIAGHSEGSLLGMIAAKKNTTKFISIAGAGKPAHELIKEQLASQPASIKNITFPLLDSLKDGYTIQDYGPMYASLFRPSIQPYLISWFSYNPTKEIASLSIPVLIIQGDKDVQVSVNDALMLSSAKKDAQYHLIKGMNHVLKIIGDNKSDNMKSYSDPTWPIAEELIQTIVAFIKK